MGLFIIFVLIFIGLVLLAVGLNAALDRRETRKRGKALAKQVKEIFDAMDVETEAVSKSISAEAERIMREKGMV